MHRPSEESRNCLCPGVMTVLVDGWQIMFQIDGLELEYCGQSISPDKGVLVVRPVLNGLDYQLSPVWR